MSKGNPVGACTDWLSNKGPGYPVVISSRARTARNIDGLKFPTVAAPDELEKARGIALEVVSRCVAEDRDWNISFAEELSPEDLGYMVEEHLVSGAFAGDIEGRAIASDWKEPRSVLVNEEDHIRIQAVLPGAQFKNVWKVVDELDSIMDREILYSFDPGMGYLTSCPSNAGTGLRISAMLHLPALVITGEIAKTISALGSAGIYVRGLHGEGSGVAGNIFQISNRRTLGESEESIVSYMEYTVQQIVDNERTARKMMLRDSEIELSDRVYRALGIVERARRLYYQEALELVSQLKLGLDLDILAIKEFYMPQVEVSISPHHMTELTGVDVDSEAIDRERAIYLRRLLDL
ncbi:MAG: ATP--guanido phosphotransferase [Actinobacteria bacterium]|nr:ATP--guanido phosphotransferase [Actinomycetota bacterium]